MGLDFDGVDEVKSGLVAFCFPGQGSLEVSSNRLSRGAARCFELGHVRGGERARFQKTFHQFSHKMVAVGRAAAVAANQELVPVSISCLQQIEGRGQVLLARLEHGITLQQ